MRELALINSPGYLNANFRRIYDVASSVVAAGERVVLEVRSLSKTRAQEEKYHAMIGEIAAQMTLHGKRLGAEAWKRLLVDAFKHDTKHDPELRQEWDKFGSIELMPALNHDGFVAIGEQTRKFSVKLASAFIEWLLAFGAENGVTFST